MRYAVAAAVLFALTTSARAEDYPTGLSVEAIKLGKHQAVLVRSGEHAALIEPGPDNKILQALRERNVTRVDYVIVAKDRVLDDVVGAASAIKLLSPKAFVWCSETGSPIYDSLTTTASRYGVKVITPTGRTQKFPLGPDVEIVLMPGVPGGPQAKNLYGVVVHGKGFEAVVYGGRQAVQSLE